METTARGVRFRVYGCCAIDGESKGKVGNDMGTAKKMSKS